MMEPKQDTDMPQMAELNVKLKMPLLEMNSCRQEAKASGLDIDDFVSRIVTRALRDEGTENIRDSKPVFELFDEISASVPIEAWKTLPTDLSENFDQYRFDDQQDD